MSTPCSEHNDPGPLVDFPIYDADQHYYEPPDCFTRHLEKQFQRVIRWADVGDRRTILVHGKQSMLVPNPTFDPVAAPGTMELYYRAKNHEGRELRDMVRMQPIQPEYRERSARVARLDQQGVEQAWLNPTLGLGIEEMLQEDPAAAVAIVRAYNRWLEEDWGFDRDGRILAGPLISLIDAREAELEVDRVLELGTRLVVMRAGPVPSPHGRPLSPADPRHDRVWAKLAEAGVVVTIHAGDAGYTRYLADWGESPRYMGKKTSPLSDVLSLGIERPVHDMMAALICHGLFDRHPKLKVATLELGSAWVPALHRKLRAAYGMAPQRFARDPVEAFREHVWVAPFYEDNLERLRDCHGADRILLGSDWPHPEGLAEPRNFIADLASLGASDLRLAVRENQRALTDASVSWDPKGTRHGAH